MLLGYLTLGVEYGVDILYHLYSKNRKVRDVDLPSTLLPIRLVRGHRWEELQVCLEHDQPLETFESTRDIIVPCSILSKGFIINTLRDDGSSGVEQKRTEDPFPPDTHGT